MPIYYLKSRLTRTASGLFLCLLWAALAWFGCLYRGFIADREASRAAAYLLPVEIVISDSTGTETEGLCVVGEPLYAFMKNKGPYDADDEAFADLLPYLGEVRMKCELDGSVRGISGTQLGGELVALTAFGAVPAFDPKAGTGSVVYFDGKEHDLSDPGAYDVIVPERMLEAIGTDEEGSLLPVKLESYIPAARHVTYTTEAAVTGYYTGVDSTTVYVSWQYAVEIKDGLKARLSASSISATAADNTKLDELRERLGRHFNEVRLYGGAGGEPRGSFLTGNGTVTSAGYGNYLYAVTIHDENLRDTLGDLDRSIALLKRLLPILTLIEMAAAAVAAYFFIYVRKRELAVARSLGTPKKSVLVAIAAELLIWFAAALAVSAAASAVVPLSGIQAGPILLIDLSALTGAEAAGYRACGKIGLVSLKEEE
jgi:hypothetical protein|nr:hypothetical protein [uncultured Acetatifactor sp.]